MHPTISCYETSFYSNSHYVQEEPTPHLLSRCLLQIITSLVLTLSIAGWIYAQDPTPAPSSDLEVAGTLIGTPEA